MAELPTGTVTFLFTDLEGSTRLWEEHPETMKAALARHDAILRDSVEAHSGFVVKTTGDGLHAAFARAHDALAAAVVAQRALTAEAWLLPRPLLVRMGLHTGETDLRDGDYYGTAINRAARVASVGHGGQLVCSLATEELVRDVPGTAVGLVDLGEHRLRDLGRPERLFQVTAEGLASKFAPLRTLDAYPGNLPPQRTSFVGRQRELQTVATALDESKLVTLTGVGGVGKTRLALQFAAEMLPRYPGGAWIVELAPVRDPEAVVGAVASSIDAPLTPGRPPLDSISDHLRGRDALMIVDNCEHLLGAVAVIIDELGLRCTDLTVLATSREGLGVSGERIVPVGALPFPAPDAGVDQIAAVDAVRLFTDRAEAATADFTVTPMNAAAVAQICRRLDGVPLALELAAARVRALSPDQIAERLDQRFVLLTGGRRIAAERHQTLRAAIDWSYELLSEMDRAALRRLAVFSGGCTLDAAELVLPDGVLEGPDVLDTLASLVDKSLVIAGDDDAGQIRYGLLETIRQYAQERLDDAGESAATRQRHADYVAAFASEAGVELRGSGVVEWTLRAERELDNLAAAMAWFAETGDASTAIGITVALGPLALGQQPGSVGGLFVHAVQVPGAENDPRYPSALAGAAQVHAQQGRFELAAQQLATLEEHAARLGVPLDHVAYFLRSIAEMYLGHFADAIADATKSLELARVARDDFATGRAQISLAANLAMSGRIAEGAPLADESLTISRRIGNTVMTSQALVVLGFAIRDQDPDRALTVFNEAADLDGLGNSMNLGVARANTGRLHAQAGQFDLAAKDLAEALRVCGSRGMTMETSNVLVFVADALTAAGDYEPAAVLHGTIAALAPGMAESPHGGIGAARDRIEKTVGPDRYQAWFARGSGLAINEATRLGQRAVEELAAVEPPPEV